MLEELEEQQATVSSISHFILVESEETKGLEEELALLGERWHKLCKGCEERHAHMETTNFFRNGKNSEKYFFENQNVNNKI